MGTVQKKERTPAAERILRTASEMFYRDGIRAVGVDAIAAEASVPKKTLYDKFGSKDRLIADYLRARDERWRAWLMEFVQKRGGSAVERILSTFDALEVWRERENYRGCAFVNAAAEFPDDNHPARVAVLEQKRWMREYLTGLCEEAGAVDPEALAVKLFILHEGATVAYSLGPSTGVVPKARGMAEIVVASPGT